VADHLSVAQGHLRDHQFATLAQCIDDVVLGVAAVRGVLEGGRSDGMDASDVGRRFRSDHPGHGS